MIKSKTMKKNILLFLGLIIILAGCGKQKQPELQRFEGETVATLQTPAISIIDESLTSTAEALLGPGETPGFLTSEPTRAPGDDVGTTPTITQASPDQNQITTTEAYPLSSTTPQFTETPPTPLGDPVWVGTWNIWYQNSTGTYTASTMSVQISGDQLTGTSTLNNMDFTFTGEFTNQGKEIEGKWKTSQNVGNFWWQMIYANTFVGSRDDRFGFCGDRMSTNRPDTCRKLPSN
jgi:hypothetical protein